MDRETGGQEKCMSLLERIVLCSIATKRRYMYRREGGMGREGVEESWRGRNIRGGKRGAGEG